MRISSQMITWNSQARLQTNLQAIERLNEDISSGIRIRKMSDNPNAGRQILQTGSSMRAIDQFRRNISAATIRTSTEEVAINQLSNNLSRALELGVAQSSATANTQTRLMAKTEVDQLLQQAVSLGNMRIGDDYLFAGTRAGEQPFRMPPTLADSFSNLTDGSGSVDPSGNIQFEIGDGHYITPNHNGTDAFLSTDALESLRALSTALGNDDTVAIQAAMDRISSSNSKVQTLFGTLGARASELETAKTALDGVQHSLEIFRADLRDTEVDKAIAELVGKQTLYQAAMSATSRILGLSLANYM
jgi:flagellar hook-associated protein 3 FlgL